MRLFVCVPYRQPFLASAVGVPTIISSSLTTTIDLLKEYAIVVDRLENIPDAIRNYEFPKLLPRSEHFWEHYELGIQKLYCS